MYFQALGITRVQKSLEWSDVYRYNRPLWMKKVFSSCSGAVLFNNLFMICLQKGSVDCISRIEVSHGLSGLSFIVVSLFEFVSLGHGFLVSLSISGCHVFVRVNLCKRHWRHPCTQCKVLLCLGIAEWVPV